MDVSSNEDHTIFGKEIKMVIEPYEKYCEIKLEKVVPFVLAWCDRNDSPPKMRMECQLTLKKIILKWFFPEHYKLYKVQLNDAKRRVVVMCGVCRE